jgi:hypothetical protein
MNAPPDASGSMRDEWTFETLRAHLVALMDANDRRYEQRFGDQNTAVNAALQAAEKAVTKAEAASEKRFESVNEFRETLSDQARTFIPRAEAELRMGTIERDLSTLKNANVERRGQSVGAKEMWGYVAFAIGLVLTVLSILSRYVK